ncbi:MAG: hypothetical protein SNJ78_04815 [Spirochaetales bacterium]
MKSQILLLPMLLAALVLLSCSGKSRSSGKEEVGSRAASEKNTVEQTIPVQPSSEAKASSEPKAQERRVPMVSRKDTSKAGSSSVPGGDPQRATLDPLFGIPTQTILPSDFDLGVLSLSTSVPEIVRRVEEIFSYIKAGKTIEPFLHPEYRWFLSEEVKAFQNRKATDADVRLGSIQRTVDGGVEVSWKLLHDGKRSLGLFVFEQKENIWYLTDLFIGEEQVSLGSDGKGEPFDPFHETWNTY